MLDAIDIDFKKMFENINITINSLKIEKVFKQIAFEKTFFLFDGV